MRRAIAGLGLALAVSLLAGCASSYDKERTSISSDAVLNNLGAAGAPQQAVAAEWAIRDFAELMVKQNTEHSYLLYAVVGLLALSFLSTLVMAGRLSRTNRELVELRQAAAPIEAAVPSPPSQEG
jgi:hypothetical protein